MILNTFDRFQFQTPQINNAMKIALLLILSSMFIGCATSPTADKQESVARAFSFWPPFPEEPRVQFLTSYQYSGDVEAPRSKLDELIYGKEEQVLPINKPYGVEMRNGVIYICDTRNKNVMVLDLQKHETRLIGKSGMARMGSPTDIDIAEDGMIYVSDLNRGVIFAFDENERHVISIGFEGFQPTGVAVFGDEIYACDFGENKVEIFNRFTGERLRSIGERGDQDGQFVRPLGIDIDLMGNVYVSDVVRCRIQKFSPGGVLLSAYGTHGDTFGSFARPKLLAVDREGITYVVDASFSNVQMFNQKNELLMFFGTSGDHPGSMLLPVGVSINEDSLEYFTDYIHPAFEAQRLILVTNQFGTHKVSVYALGALKEGMTVQDVSTARYDISTGLTTELRDDPMVNPPQKETPSGEQPPGGDGS